MMKKTLTLLAALVMALTSTACVRRSNQAYYEQAQLMLGGGSYEEAAELFSQLGEYRDSADYVLYVRALEALEVGDLPLARANFEVVAPFKSSERYLRVVEALEAETEGRLADALAIYETLGSFHGADEAVKALETAIPDEAMRKGRELMSKGEYEAARDIFLSLDGYGKSVTLAENCTKAINEAAYTVADELCESGDHLAALQAFEALGDALDAADRARQCRADILQALAEQAQNATLLNAAEVIAACGALGGEEAAALAAALTERFGVNLELLEAADEQPYVELGQYPTGESGAEGSLLWRILSVDGVVATLLCETVIDASQVATPTDLTFPEDTEGAVTAPQLPSAADLVTLNDLECAATPYAIAQGVSNTDGLALYWLRDSLEGGMHPVVSDEGRLSLPDASAVPGVRPMITLSLEDYAFTQGDGSLENPFR